MQDRITEIHRLGFGKCALRVQTPDNGPFKSVEDLAGKRVVTSFEVLAGAYFDKIDEQMNLTGDQKTKIQYIGGSVEAACALGLADGIGERQVRMTVYEAHILNVEQSILLVRCCFALQDLSYNILESGDTMRAAGLRAIATILETEAVLIKSNVPHRAHHAPLIDLIASRIAGVVAAGKYVICEYNIRRDALRQATAITPGRKAPTISPLEEEGWVAVSSMVEKKIVATTMDELVKIGAEDILIFNLDNCRV